MDELKPGRERFEYVFRKRTHVFLIAIHVTPNPKEWQADIDIARSEGADGIIVIRDYHTLATDDDVLVAYEYARERYRHWWIGINLLDHEPLQATLRARNGTSGIWFDDVKSAENFGKLREKSDIFHLPNPPLLIPSVAMKYIRPDEDVAAVAKLVEPYADIIVTSGQETGKPPSIEKVKALRAAVEAPIGICSGTDIDNVEMFMQAGVEVFIVNTSLNTVGKLDGEKVARMQKKFPR